MAGNKPPKQIAVGPFTWDVIPNGRLDDNEYGTTDLSRLEVKIMQGIPADLQRETMFHELLHTVLFVHGMEPSKQEVIVQKVSPILFQALRDNPELRKFLFG